MKNFVDIVYISLNGLLGQSHQGKEQELPLSYEKMYNLLSSIPKFDEWLLSGGTTFFIQTKVPAEADDDVENSDLDDLLDDEYGLEKDILDANKTGKKE